MLTTNEANLVLENFTVKVFLDTNILVYLVDDLYDSLNMSIGMLEECMFTTLISSSFVVFEFIGARRREHFLRKYLQENFVKDASDKFDINKVNLLSVLKHTDTYEKGGNSYDVLRSGIQANIESDLKKLSENLKVDYDKNVFHDKLFEPTKQLFLISRISKEDCLVVTSAVWPDALSKNDNVLLLSNDSDFIHKLEDDSIKAFFADKSTVPPSVTNLKKVGKRKYDLTKVHDSQDLKLNMLEIVSEIILSNNEKYYLGKTVAPPKNLSSIVFFDLKAGKTLGKEIFIVIIGKDLDFFYVSAESIGSFRSGGKEISLPFTSQVDTGISFKLDVNQDIDLKSNIHHLMGSGHKVFIHPDSLLPEIDE